jgi:hypothetical protein
MQLWRRASVYWMLLGMLSALLLGHVKGAEAMSEEEFSQCMAALLAPANAARCEENRASSGPDCARFTVVSWSDKVTTEEGVERSSVHYSGMCGAPDLARIFHKQDCWPVGSDDNP